MSDFFRYIISKYEMIVPDKQCGLLLVILYQKIKNKEISNFFTYHEIEKCIKEIAEVEFQESIPQTHRILEKLMNYYIERPPDNSSNKYTLTSFAGNFLKLIEHKFDNPLAKLPLRKSFEKYGGFSAIEIESIDDFETWYQNGFSNTTQNIISHLESLNDELGRTIHELKEVLYSTHGGTLQKVQFFNNKFKSLGERAVEISDALSLKNKLKREIGDVVTAFYEQLDNHTSPSSVEDESYYEKLESRYRRAQYISDQVDAFFSKVDYRLNQLQEKIMYADDRLNDLKDNFDYKSKFNSNTIKLLRLALSQSTYTKEGISFSNDFPQKSFYEEFVRYNRIVYLDFGVHTNNNLIEVKTDSKLYKQEIERINIELDRQQRISELANLYKNTLDVEKQMDFTERFYKTLHGEDDLEIAIQVGFEIIQHALNSGTYELKIEKYLSEEILREKVLTWKTKILSKQK